MELPMQDIFLVGPGSVSALPARQVGMVSRACIKRDIAIHAFNIRLLQGLKKAMKSAVRSTQGNPSWRGCLVSQRGIGSRPVALAER
jgi:hypothetical protein